LKNAKMEHTDATLSHAVERYLLGEMTEAEQGIFEEHFFDCPVCAADVTDGTRMMIAGRAVVEEKRAEEDRAAAATAQPSNVVPMPIPSRWLPAAAAASLIFGLIGGGTGYQIANRQHHEPTALVRVARLDTGLSRAGTPPEIPIVRPGEVLRFDVEPDDAATQYEAVIRCGGKSQSTHGISREMAADAVSLRLGELPAGRCELVIEGVREDGKRFEITTSPFEVGER
jgi:hypothetical protein